VDRVGLAEHQDVRDLLRAELGPASAHDQDSARDLVVLRVPAGYCLDLVRLLRDAPRVVPRHVAAATSATRRPKKAR
jgi:mRNA-degrading endonuclease toxin of MazEF toxin-antitoxin module